MGLESIAAFRAAVDKLSEMADFVDQHAVYGIFGKKRPGEPGFQYSFLGYPERLRQEKKEVAQYLAAKPRYDAAIIEHKNAAQLVVRDCSRFNLDPREIVEYVMNVHDGLLPRAALAVVLHLEMLADSPPAAEHKEKSAGLLTLRELHDLTGIGKTKLREILPEAATKLKGTGGHRYAYNEARDAILGYDRGFKNALPTACEEAVQRIRQLTQKKSHVS